MVDQYSDDTFVDPPWLQARPSAAMPVPPPPPPTPMFDVDRGVLGADDSLPVTPIFGAGEVAGWSAGQPLPPPAKPGDATIYGLPVTPGVPVPAPQATSDGAHDVSAEGADRMGTEAESRTATANGKIAAGEMAGTTGGNEVAETTSAASGDSQPATAQPSRGRHGAPEVKRPSPTPEPVPPGSTQPPQQVPPMQQVPVPPQPSGRGGPGIPQAEPRTPAMGVPHRQPVPPATTPGSPGGPTRPDPGSTNGLPPQVAHAMQRQAGPGPQCFAPRPPDGQRPLAQRGWRKVVNSASGGLIRLGESRSRQQLNALVDRARTPINGQFNLAVLSLKGGVGKTTTTVGVGSVFASLRGDRVIAVDANPDLGTLSSRVPRQTNSTVRTLVNSPHVDTYADVRMHTSQSLSRLEVLASERDPVVSESFSEDEYRRVIDILQRHYNVILTDCGTGLMHSAMSGVLSVADALIIISSPALDGAESATATLDWLSLHGYQHLVRQAIVVISASKPGGALIDLDMLTEHFMGKVRAVQIIPYDEHLAIGGHVDLDSLNQRTRTAFLELAATVADAFGPPSQTAWPSAGPRAAPMPSSPGPASSQPQSPPSMQSVNMPGSPSGGQTWPSTGTPPTGMPPNGSPSNGLPPNGLPPNGLSQNGIPPAGMAPAGMRAADIPPTGVPPTGMVPPHAMPTTGIPLSGNPMPQQPQRPGPAAASNTTTGEQFS